MDEFGAGPSVAPAEEDFSKLPIEDRLKHKNWKARVSAYEELSKSFAASAYDTDPIFKPYTRNAGLVKAMVVDSNAVAQEKGVAAVCDFVRYGGREAGSTRETVVPALVEKCLGSARGGTKKAAIELVSLYAENEDVMGCGDLVNDVLAGLSAKQPKVVAGCVAALTPLVRDFGPKQVVPKPILKRIPDVFAHSDKTVRAEGALLAQELHRYLGAALEPTIDSLKDIQAKELRAQFEQIDAANGKAAPTPTRHLFSQKAAAEAAAAAAAGVGGGAAAGEDAPADGGDGDDGADAADGFDAYELAEPVDPLKAKQWPSNFDEQVKSAKWSERKEAFESAKAVLTANIKLQPSNAFDFFVDACVERVKKDATVHVWLTACQCLEAAAKGMRGDFAKYRDRTVPPLLEKLKEKKQSTVDVLAATLDAIFQTVTFSEILEDVLAATKHKNPNVKTESIRFLLRCLRTTKTAPSKGDIKPIADALLAACSDGSGDVRDAGTQGLGTLMKLIGERPMNPYLDQLDDIKKAKVQDEFAKATVKVKMGGAAAGGAARPPAAKVAPPAPASRPPAPRAPASKPTSMAAPPSRPAAPASAPRAAAPPPRAPAARPAPSAKPGPSAAPRTAAMPSASRAAPSTALPPSAPVKFRFTPEEAEAKAGDLIPSEIAAQLANANWKERLAGTQAFASWLDRESESIEAELIVRALGKKPGWKESNFQVFAEVFKVFRLLAEQCPTFGRATVALSIQPLCDKLGDIKLKAPAGETLTTYSEKTSFGFVLKQALGPLAALKAPKAVADSLLWIDAALLEFGITAVEVKSLVAHLLTCLKSANAAVRNNATTVMGTLARFLGPTLNSFLNDLNPQLKTTIEGEIEKAASNPAPAPTRFSAELRQPEVAGGSGDDAASAAAAAAAEEDALDALVPRVDIDKLIPSSALANMGDANWKVRKESLEEIQSILQANTRLKGTLSDLAPVIKLRYSDSNIMCKQLALDIAAKLAAGLGKNFEPQARNFVTPVSQCLADAKAPVRQAAATTLTAIADAAGVPSMIGGFASVLDGKAANPQLRQDLFAWLAARFEAHPPDKSYDLAPLALHAVHCLDDKLAAVKKAALATLPYIIQRAGYKFVLSQSDGMKAASKNTVVPLIDQARSAANALAPAGGAAAASSAPAATSRPGAARPAATAAKPAAVRSLASAARPASPAMRSSSPSPASPRASAAPASRLAGGMRPPSAATRTLQAPSSRLAAPAAGAAKAGFSSRLGVAKKAVMATATSPAAAAAAGSSTAPLLTSDPKHKLARERKEARGGWISAEGTARPELVETLQSQCEGHISAELIDSMFSRDHNAERDYLSALALLADFVSSPTFAQEEYGVPQTEAVGRVVANSDLVLKYIAIRLTDNNTSISLKCFDVLGHLVDLLRTEQYHMTDYEANSILPCLIAKFGDAKVAFRDRIRDTFRKLTFIYPPSKLMTQYLDNGLPSKNARTRAECLGELGYLFSKNGLQVCTPSKTLPVIAKSISDRDTNVRTAALLALGECYKIVGDEIWSLVGRLPDKEMSLLEERLKRTTVAKQPTKTAAVASPSSPPPAAAPSGLRAPRPTTTTRIPSGIPPPGAKSRLPSSTASRQVPVAHEPVDVAAEDVEPVVAHGDEGEEEAEGDVGEPDVEQAISEILSSEPERSTQALKAIHHEMQADAAPFAPSADQLASVLAKQFGRAFGKGTTNEAPNARLRKYLIQVASTLFDSKMRSRQGHTVASFIEKQSLGALMTQLLQRLIDTSNQAKTDEDARTYATYLNKVVIRCFGSCNLNVLYSTSFTMLGDATEDLRELVGATLETRFRFAELIIKCLWKVGRRLPSSLQQGTVEPAELLAVLEAFLQRIPPAEWKARARDDVPLKDLPLRTIKVILSHFVQVLGEDVLSHLDKLENPEGAEVYKILVRMINQSTGGEGGDEEGDSDDAGDVVGGRGESDHDPPTSDTRAHSSPSSSSPGLNGNTAVPPLASPPVDDAANAELKDIFERISQKEQSRKAIKDLYEFQKRFPAKQSHIERSLQSTGPIFQRYIKRALANHAAEDEERADSGGGAGTPTSPPVAAASSPPASTRTSQSGLGHGRVLSSESGGVNSPDRRVSSSSQATEERLAALRQKFYNRAPSSPRSTVNGGAVGDGVD